MAIENWYAQVEPAKQSSKQSVECSCSCHRPDRPEYHCHRCYTAHDGECAVCGKETRTERHHLIPKELGPVGTVRTPFGEITYEPRFIHLCPDHHAHIHRVFSNIGLAKHCDTAKKLIEALRFESNATI